MVAIGRLWIRRKILDVDPRRPRRGEAAGSAGGAQPLRRGADLGPGLRRHLGVEAGGAEQVLVVIEDRGRGIERERQHVAGDVGVVAGDRGQIGGRRKRFGFVAHQFEDRIGRALRGHHGRGGDFVDLHDGRLAARAERKDRRRHRLGVVALVARHDPVFGLRRVEIGGELFQLPAEFARHRVPPRDLGDRISRRRRGQRNGGCDERGTSESRFHHKTIPNWRGRNAARPRASH